MLLAENQIALDDTGLVMIIAVSALLLGLAGVLVYVAARCIAASRRAEGANQRRNLLLRAGGAVVLGIGSAAIWYALLQNSPPRSATIREDALVLHYRRSEVAIPWSAIKDVTYNIRKTRRSGEAHRLVIETTAGQRKIQVSSAAAAEGVRALRREIEQRTRGPRIKLPPVRLDLGTRPATRPQ